VTDSSRDSDPPLQHEGMTADDFDAPEAQMRRAVSALVGSKQGQELIKSFIHERLGPGIQPELFEDLVQGASVEAITSKWLPLLAGGMQAWLRRLTRRTIAQHFKGEQVHRKYLDREKDAEQERDRDDHGTDVAARELRILSWLRTVITDARDQQTLALMFEHEEAGVPLADLAAREKTTPSGLSNRFYKLRLKYAPHLSIMDDEPKRRAVLLALLLFGLGAVVVFVVWLLRGPPAPPPPAPPAPSATVAPSAGPAPTFDQALPPPPTPPSPPRGPDKPVVPGTR
jgi:DNA-directed RNA polymerase specialized sigma24 family protein